MQEPEPKKNWWTERFPFSTLINWFLKEEIPGGSRFISTLGSASLFLFLILVLSGIWQMFIYDPLDQEASNSLIYLRVSVPFGWLIHGLHYWGAIAFLVVVVLHMLRVFIWGAYKKPRELVWLIGIVLLILTVLFLYTGSILPWDYQGYWACQLGMNTVGAISGVGSFFQSLFWGADQMGQSVLSRIFVWHVEILPILTALFIVIHLVAFRVYGSAGPWNDEKRKVKGLLWPEQIFKDTVVAFLLFILLIGLTVYFPPPMPCGANLEGTINLPKPEWNFAFFFQILNFFRGRWVSIAFVTIPLVIILFFASLPFFDRSTERNPAKRLVVISIGAFFFLFVIVFSILGLFSNPNQSGANQTDPPPPSDISTIVDQEKPKIEETVATKKANLANGMVGDADHGEKIYERYCLCCHGPNGNINSPDFRALRGVTPLSPINAAYFSPDPAKFLQNIDPAIQHGAPNLENGPIMIAYGDSDILTQQEITDVKAYILELNYLKRAKKSNLGILPKTFFYIVIGISGFFFILVLLWYRFQKKC